MYRRLAITALLSLFFLHCLSLGHAEEKNGLFELTGLAGFFYTYKNDWMPATEATLSKGDLVRFDGGILSEGQHKRIAVLNPCSKGAMMFEYGAEKAIHLESKPEIKDNATGEFLFSLYKNGSLFGINTNSRKLLESFLTPENSKCIGSLNLDFELEEGDVTTISKLTSLAFLNIDGFKTDAARTLLINRVDLRCVAVDGELNSVFYDAISAAFAMKLKHVHVRITDKKEERFLAGLAKRVHSLYIEWKPEEQLSFVSFLDDSEVKNLTFWGKYDEESYATMQSILRTKHSLNFYGIKMTGLHSGSIKDSRRRIDCNDLAGLQGFAIECRNRTDLDFHFSYAPAFRVINSEKSELQYIDLRWVSIKGREMLFPKLTDMYGDCLSIYGDDVEKEAVLPTLRVFSASTFCRGSLSFLNNKKLISSNWVTDEAESNQHIETYQVDNVDGFTKKNKAIFEKTVDAIQIFFDWGAMWEKEEDWNEQVVLPEGKKIIAFGASKSKIGNIPRQITLFIISPSGGEVSWSPYPACGAVLQFDRKFLD